MATGTHIITISIFAIQAVFVTSLTQAIPGVAVVVGAAVENAIAVAKEPRVFAGQTVIAAFQTRFAVFRAELTLIGTGDSVVSITAGVYAET